MEARAGDALSMLRGGRGTGGGGASGASAAAANTSTAEDAAAAVLAAVQEVHAKDYRKCGMACVRGIAEYFREDVAGLGFEVPPDLTL